MLGWSRGVLAPVEEVQWTNMPWRSADTMTRHTKPESQGVHWKKWNTMRNEGRASVRFVKREPENTEEWLRNGKRYSDLWNQDPEMYPSYEVKLYSPQPYADARFFMTIPWDEAPTEV